MMENCHTITAQDKWFLDKHMKDPVTQEYFNVGDCIIICADCKAVHDVSTWGLLPQKCCSICGSNQQLNYNTFSPVIFQHSSTHNAGFRVVEKKVTFTQRLQFFNAYPVARFVTFLLPILAAAMFFYSVQNQEESVSITIQMASAIQENFISFADESQFKLTHIISNKTQITDKIQAIDKIQSIDAELGNMDYKLSSIQSSLSNMEPKIADTNVDLKVKKIGINISAAAGYVRDKVLRLTTLITEYISN